MVKKVKETSFFVKAIAVFLLPLLLFSSCSKLSDPFAEIRDPLPLYKFEFDGMKGQDYRITPKKAVRLINAHVREVYQTLYPKEDSKKCPLIQGLEEYSYDDFFFYHYGTINKQLLLDFTEDSGHTSYIALQGKSSMSKQDLKAWNAYAFTLLYITEGYDRVSAEKKEEFRLMINDFKQYFSTGDIYETKLGSTYLACYDTEFHGEESGDFVSYHLSFEPMEDDPRNYY